MNDPRPPRALDAKITVGDGVVFRQSLPVQFGEGESLSVLEERVRSPQCQTNEALTEHIRKTSGGGAEDGAQRQEDEADDDDDDEGEDKDEQEDGENGRAPPEKKSKAGDGNS